MSDSAESGRGGRTSLREDADLLGRTFTQVGAQEPSQGDAVVPEKREVVLGRIESAIVKDLTREFFRTRCAPIGKAKRDDICLWHSITPPITWISVLRRKEALGTDEANTTGHRLVISYTGGVIFRNSSTGETWCPIDLKGQEPGCDGKLRGDSPEADELLWPAELPGGIWIMRPDADQPTMGSRRRQDAIEVLYQSVRVNGPGEQRSSGLSAIIGGSSPRSVIRDFVQFGILHKVGGTTRSPTDPSRYVTVLRPYRDKDGNLITPPECERWVELGPVLVTESPEQAPSVAITSKVKTKEEIEGEVAEMEKAIEVAHEAQRTEAVAEVSATISVLGQRIPALEESIQALKDELKQTSDELEAARASREETLGELVLETTPEIEEFKRQIALRRQLLGAYDLLFKR
jgi:hypothetical protein